MLGSALIRYDPIAAYEIMWIGGDRIGSDRIGLHPRGEQGAMKQ